MQPQTSACPDPQQAIELLAPLSLDEFARCYWERRAVVISGSIAKLERLGLDAINREGFVHDVGRSANEARAGFAIGALKADWTETADKPFVYIESQAIEGMIAEGLSIAIESFGDARLAELIATLKLQLGHAGEVRIDAVLSPPGEGFPIHMDRASVIIVQVAGRKRWRISDDPVLRWPSGTTAFTAAGEVAYRDHTAESWEDFEQIEMPELREVVLEPGDVLYIPAGTLHTTTAMDEPSLSISLIFAPLRTLDLFSRVLARQLGSEPAWRNVPGVAEPGVLTDQARQFLAARLTELRALVDQLTPEDLAFQHEWQRGLADPGETTRARLVAKPVDEALTLTPETRLRRSTRIPMPHVEGVDAEGEPWLTAFHRDRELNVAGEWTGFLRTLLARDEFLAGTAMDWTNAGVPFPWSGVRDALRALIDEGVIELVVD